MTGTARPALRVGFVLANNFTMSAFSLFVDVLRLAADEGDRSRPLRCAWSVMSGRAEPIRSSCGVLVQPTGGFAPPEEFDYVVLVGGLLHGGPSLDAATRAYLQQVAASRTALAGVCTGGHLLCREGLMRDRTCCVSWYHYQDFVNEFPDHAVTADRLYLMDGNRITCSGGSGVADLAAALVERHLGASPARKALDILQYGRARPAEAAQPHPPMAAPAGDERVRRCLLLMEQNMTVPLPMTEIATRLRLSVRQLERLFQDTLGLGPTAAYRDLRLRYAVWLLETTRQGITEVAHQAGFTDGAHFSNQFRRAFGRPPSLWRSALPPAAEPPRRPPLDHRPTVFAPTPAPP